MGGFVLHFSLESADASMSVSTTFAGTNQMTGATIVQNGGYAKVTYKDGLPQSGVYTVNGGTLELSAGGCAIGRGISYGNTRLVVKDGVLVQSNGNVIDGVRQAIELDNSELRLCSAQTPGSNVTWTDANTYVNNLVLRNGSRVTTALPRLTYSANALWTVAGTGTCSCAQQVVCASTGDQLAVFDVGETTGDATADLNLKGGIRSYDVAHKYWYLIKKGTGTLQLSGASWWNRPAGIRAGELRVAGNGLMRPTSDHPCPVSLQGGLLAFTANTSNSVGVISVTTNSALALAEGSVVAAADASGATWTARMKLFVTGPSRQPGKRTGLRFGQSACLTEQQIRAIRYNDAVVTQDAEGWICAGGYGTQLIFR